MSAKARKRSRPLSDEHRADCPFTATILKDTPQQDVVAGDGHGHGHRSKKRKHDGHHSHGHGHDEERRVLVQNSPFHPAGKFKTHDFLRIGYNVDPSGNWLDMTRYNSFVLNGVKYYTDDFVYVANDRTVERHKEPITITTTMSKDDSSNDGSSRRASEYWVARILEVRASDEHHVYARVYWMYWPDELPAGTLDGKKTTAGRQPYHGLHELVASNHMDIINVVSVVMAASVRQWVESDDEEIQDALYWRQAFDCRTSQFSTIELVCRCMTPANPDKTLVGCTNAKCEKWMHYECLLEDVLTRVYGALGTNTPFVAEKGIVVKEEEEKVTPTKVKEEESGSTPSSYVQSQSTLKPTDNAGAGLDLGTRTTTPATTTTATTPVPDQGHPLPPEKPPRHSATTTTTTTTTTTRDARRRKSLGKRPYEGLFQATLRMDQGPMLWEVTDLRTNIVGGDKIWTEKAYCLVCNSVLD